MFQQETAATESTADINTSLTFLPYQDATYVIDAWQDNVDKCDVLTF